MKHKDLIGQTFGKYKVIGKNPYRGTNNKRVYWDCQCECGTLKPVLGSSLSCGDAKSCGCGKLVDMVGKRFNRLIVLSRAGKTESDNLLVLCQCDCGNNTTTQYSNLLTGATGSCGCLRKETYNETINDLTGQKFDKLLVIRIDKQRTNDRGVCWLVHCDCGVEKVVSGHSLINKNARSCGCIRKDGEEAKRSQEPHITTAKLTFASNDYRDGGGDLSFDDFYEFSQQNCFYCNRVPSTVTERYREEHSRYYKENCAFIYNGVDRLDPTDKAHNKANCVTCCHDCNTGKSDQTIDDFLDRVKCIVSITNIGRVMNVIIPPDNKIIKRMVDTNIMKFHKNSQQYHMIGEVHTEFKHQISRHYNDGNLTFPQIYHLTQLNCIYCGIKPSNSITRDGQTIYYSGLDRIINNNPLTGAKTTHSIGNVVPSCTHCNFMKNNNTYEYFIEHINRIFANIPNIEIALKAKTTV
jgi:hypothetical protein